MSKWHKLQSLSNPIGPALQQMHANRPTCAIAYTVQSDRHARRVFNLRLILQKLMHLIAGLLLSASVVTLTAAANVVLFRLKAKTPRSQVVNFSRRNTVSPGLSNEIFQYLVTLQVGSPPQ